MVKWLIAKACNQEILSKLLKTLPNLFSFKLKMYSNKNLHIHNPNFLSKSVNPKCNYRMYFVLSCRFVFKAVVFLMKPILLQLMDSGESLVFHHLAVDLVALESGLGRENATIPCMLLGLYTAIWSKALMNPKNSKVAW